MQAGAALMDDADAALDDDNHGSVARAPAIF